MSHEEAAGQLRAGLQAVLDQLPPGVAVNITHQARVQGCIMMLVDMAAPAAAAAEAAAGDGDEPGWEGELGGVDIQGWEDGNDWGQEPAQHPFLHVEGEGLNLQPQQQQQQECQAYREGTWTFCVDPSSGKKALLFHSFHTISSYHAAIADGDLLEAFAVFLADAAQEAGRCEGDAAAAASDPVVVSSWGGQLKLALQGPQECLLPAKQASTSISSSSSSSMNVRVVVVHGQQVALDEEVQAAARGDELSLQVELPPASSWGGGHDPAVLAVYILPSAQHTSEVVQGAGSNNTTTRSGGRDVMLGPLAHVTLLLLPAPAAAELLQWVELYQLSQKQLQPLLDDMALAVEAAAAAATAGAMSGSAAMWEGAAAAAAAGRVVSVCDSYNLAACADLMAVASQQLLVALRRVEPLAAGELPPITAATVAAAMVGHPPQGDSSSGIKWNMWDGVADQPGAPGPTGAPAAAVPEGSLATETAAAAPEALRATAAGAAEAIMETTPEAGPAGAAERSSLAEAEEPGMGTNSSSFAATAGLRTAGDTAEKSSTRGAAGSGTMRMAQNLSKRQKGAAEGRQEGNAQPGSSSSRVPSTQAVLLGGWSFWCWCVGGSLVGWSDRQLEAGYLAARVQHGSRPATWIMMGVMDVASGVVTGPRVLYNAGRGRIAGEVMVAGAYMPLVLLPLTRAYGLWLLLCSRAMRHRFGFVSIISEVLKFAGWYVQVYVGGTAAYAELTRHGTGKAQPSYQVFVFLYTAVRIVLHQLPPPWLLPYSALVAMFVWVNYQAVPELWSGVWQAVPVWVLVGV